MRRASRRPPRRRRWPSAAAVALLAAAILLLLAVTPAFAAGGSLSRQISAALAGHGMSGSGTAVCVWNLETGSVVYARNIHRPLTPASNQKLATAAAALRLWGADHRFKTEALLVAGPDAAGVVRGDLYLKGYGDPTFSTSGYQRRVFRVRTASVARLARAIRSAGVRRITGRIVGDESYFDRRRAAPSWHAGLAAYCGSLSALALDQGYTAGRREARPAVRAADALRRALRAAGVVVSGAARAGRTPKKATVVATELSAPLWRVLRLMGKPSDNTIAEMLLKGLGREFGAGGSTIAGARVVRREVIRAGATAREVSVRDGSGLSYSNRLSALAVTRLLESMSARLDFDSYWGSLAVAGRDGTLRLRMRGSAAAGNVHAKTGTLNVSSCLSGYVTTRGREGVVFSILMNGTPLAAYRARLAQDAVAVVLARADL